MCSDRLGSWSALRGRGELGRALVLVIGAAAQAALAEEPVSPSVRLPAGVELREVDFDRHVVPLFSRLGCNSAACHGSFNGQAGFRLSLFGQSPTDDHRAIVGDAAGKRFCREKPDESLLLIKARGGEEHGGGVRCATDSWEYQVLRRWISDGGRRARDPNSIRQFFVEPREVVEAPRGSTISVRCWVELADGTREDVTALTSLRSRDEDVAFADAQGRIQVRNAGSTTVVVSYGTQFAALPVIAPYERTNPPHSRRACESHSGFPLIDAEIDQLLRQLQLDESPLADDAEFLRRASLDVIGVIPTVDEVREFLSDDDPAKRMKKIDQLLHHPRHAVLWASKFCDATVCDVEQLGLPEERRSRRAKMWHDWFRRRFQQNMPYDELVRGVLCAVSRTHDESMEDWIDREIDRETASGDGFHSDYSHQAGLDLFWRRVGSQGPLPVEDYAEITASAFLGLRLRCARCHQHPYDRWTQSDFASYANIFATVHYGASTELRQAISARLEQRRQVRAQGERVDAPEFPRLQEVFSFRGRPRSLIDASSAADGRLRPPGGGELDPESDPRSALFRWMTAADNPYFAPNIVNRVWAHYFGSGLVEPIDGFSAANPAAQPDLLARLSRDFIENGFDLRRLERQILLSNAYQRTAFPTGNNAVDSRHLSRAPVRALPAAVLVDSLHRALDVDGEFGDDAPRGSSALELAVNQFSRPDVQTMFRALGRSERRMLCDCESLSTTSLRRSLFVLSDMRLTRQISTGRVARLVAAEREDEAIVEELYLASLSRFPTDEERAACRRHLAAGGTKRERVEDLLWALLNTREFLTNH